MLNGMIFSREAIISLDLKRLLSQYYKVDTVFKKTEESPNQNSDIDFFVIDSDPYSGQELRSILENFGIAPSVKIINITSFSFDLESKIIESEFHLSFPIKIVAKPYSDEQILRAVTD